MQPHSAPTSVTMCRYDTFKCTIGSPGDPNNLELQILSNSRKITLSLLTKLQVVVSVQVTDPKLMLTRQVVPPMIKQVCAHKTEIETAIVPKRESCRGSGWYLF
jgi:hypothetical protein